MSPSELRDLLVREQEAQVRALEAELAALIEAGNEYHAEGVRLDLLAAKSPARLIHKARA